MMMGRLKIAVIMGGQSGEHEVSLKSGAGILANLDYDTYEACPVVISKTGVWHCANSYGEMHPFDAALLVHQDPEGSRTIPSFLVDSATKPDVVFPIIHGKFGEDGTLQGLLAMHGLIWVGSDVLGSALAMHKRMAKELYQFHKIPTPDYSFYTRKQWQSGMSTIPSHLIEKLGLPIFIKAPNGGSSVGMGLANTREEIREIGDRLFDESDEVLFEKSIKGTEVSCGVLETLDGTVEALLPTEIVPVSSAFFDYKAKYEKNASKEITPARLSPAMTDRVRKLAVASHQALHCSGMSRTDIMISGDSLFVLETNTLPGFTETSLLPQGAKACGIAYPELLDRIIQVALKNGD